MILPDFSLLIYAYNRASVEHEAACKWWEQKLNSAQPVGLYWVAVNGFIRISTHPWIFEKPLPAKKASAYMREWLAQSNVLLIDLGLSFQEIYLSYTDELGAAGNLTTDAYLAALAVEHQAELQSTDSDFQRFSGLRWRNPIG